MKLPMSPALTAHQFMGVFTLLIVVDSGLLVVVAEDSVAAVDVDMDAVLEVHQDKEKMNPRMVDMDLMSVLVRKVMPMVK